MTVSQLANIQHRIATDLADVVHWNKHVRPDPKQPTTGDAAYVVIATEYNRYRISCHSNYVEPPAGATYECKALGTVTFDDFAGDKHIVAPKCDATWMAISKHIHVRELTDAIAAERRMLAEAGPDKQAEIHARLVALAERGKKWGVEAKGMAALPTPQRIGLDAAPVHETDTVAPLAEPATVIVRSGDSIQQAMDYIGERYDFRSADSIYPGARIYFITNPGETISGMQELPGLCVKVYPDNSISAFVTPDHSEPFYRDKLPKRSEQHRFNCWDFNPADVELRRTLANMESRLRQFAERNEQMGEDHVAMLERIAALEERDDGLTPKATRATTKAKRSRAA